MSQRQVPAFINTRADGITLAVRVQPRASTTGIAGEHGGELRIRVQAPPVDAAANDAVIRFLATLLDCPRSAIEIVRGKSARHKVLAIRGVRADDALRRLGFG